MVHSFQSKSNLEVYEAVKSRLGKRALAFDIVLNEVGVFEISFHELILISPLSESDICFSQDPMTIKLRPPSGNFFARSAAWEAPVEAVILSSSQSLGTKSSEFAASSCSSLEGDHCSCQHVCPCQSKRIGQCQCESRRIQVGQSEALTCQNQSKRIGQIESLTDSLLDFDQTTQCCSLPNQGSEESNRSRGTAATTAHRHEHKDDFGNQTDITEKCRRKSTHHDGDDETCGCNCKMTSDPPIDKHHKFDAARSQFEEILSLLREGLSIGLGVHETQVRTNSIGIIR